MSEFLLFTDGGAFDKGQGKFRAVSSFRFFNGEKEFIKGNLTIVEEGTSPFAEINAIALGLEHVSSYIEAAELKDVHVKIYTDSMICYNSLTQWIYNWMRKAKKNNTKTFISSSGTPVANQEQIKKAFKHMTDIKKVGKVSFFHINSHTAKKNVKDLQKIFEKFNKVKLSEEDFLFIYLQNAKCDKMIEEGHAKFIENNKPKNNMLERLKEEI
jgi:ribonuclease HI